MRIFETRGPQEIDRLTTEQKWIYHSEQLCEKFKKALRK
jgi:hypothetical protein